MSFKVMCTSNRKDDESGDDAPQLQVGSKYHVVFSYVHPTYRRLVYELAEFDDIIFDSGYFSPLDGPDEQERLEAWQEKQAAEYDRQLQEIFEPLPDAI